MKARKKNSVKEENGNDNHYLKKRRKYSQSLKEAIMKRRRGEKRTRTKNQ